jgi:hypothetical protein
VNAFGGKTETEDLVVARKRALAVESYLLEKGVQGNQVVMQAMGRSMPVKADEALARKYSFLSPGQELSSEFISSLTVSQRNSLQKEVNRIHFSFLE